MFVNCSHIIRTNVPVLKNDDSRLGSMGKEGVQHMTSRLENPFSMRFVLPEQRELYLQMKQDDKLVSMPSLDQDELDSFHYMIRDSAREDYAIAVSWWEPAKQERGNICTIWGVVKWIDQNGRRIKIVNDEESLWIYMDRITNVKS